jgi:hypothetical protein
MKIANQYQFDNIEWIIEENFFKIFIVIFLYYFFYKIVIENHFKFMGILNTYRK